MGVTLKTLCLNPPPPSGGGFRRRPDRLSRSTGRKSPAPSTGRKSSAPTRHIRTDRTDMRNACTIPSLTGHRGHFAGEPLCPAPRMGQAGHRIIATRSLPRPGRKGLDAYRTRCRRQARFRTRPGRTGLVRIEPPPLTVRREGSQTDQPGGVNIPLDRPHAALAPVDALLKRLLLNRAAFLVLGMPYPTQLRCVLCTGSLHINKPRMATCSVRPGLTPRGLPESALHAIAE